jgi:hypothetical protein
MCLAGSSCAVFLQQTVAKHEQRHGWPHQGIKGKLTVRGIRAFVNPHKSRTNSGSSLKRDVMQRRLVVTDVSGRLASPIFKEKAVKEEFKHSSWSA